MLYGCERVLHDHVHDRAARSPAEAIQSDSVIVIVIVLVVVIVVVIVAALLAVSDHLASPVSGSQTC